MTKQAQSYGSVILKRKMSVYEMRVYLTIVKRARKTLYAQPLKTWIKEKPETRGIRLDFEIPIKDIVGKTHNYDKFKNTFRHLHSLQVEHYDKTTRTWKLASLIEDIELREKEGVVYFSTPKWVIDFITDFGQGGFIEYDFQKAMSLRNAFAARLYLMMVSRRTAVTMNYEMLKSILGLENKYKRFSDFKKRVLEPAKRELEEKGYNGFEYEEMRKYGRAKTEVLAIKLKPIIRESPRTLQEKIERLKSALPENVLSYFAVNLGFSSNELIGKNAATIQKFMAIKNWQEKLADISDRARRYGKNHGYIINAMKAETTNK